MKLRINNEELHKRLEEYCKQNSIFGMLRVTLKDEIVYEQSFGYADAEKKTAFSSDSMFTFYSLSKPFCAIGILKLYDRGLVDIDSHPSRYLSEASGFDTDVKIRHLLYHISGLPDFEQNRDFAARYAPGYSSLVREHLKLLSEYPQYFKPGTDTRYANVNFVICACIIENVSGMRYAEYMRREVFEPLGMKNAVVDNETLSIERRVKGYELCDGTMTEVKKSHSWMLGAGDIVGTLDDVYCLNKAIKNRLLLSDKTWSEVLTPSLLNSMGMGCTVSDWHGKKRITHNGGHIGFRTLHVQLPEDDFDIIFMSNSGFGNARNDISEMIFEAFYGTKTEGGYEICMDKGYIG